MWCGEVLPDARNSAHSCQPMLSRYLKKEDKEDEKKDETDKVNVWWRVDSWSRVAGGEVKEERLDSNNSNNSKTLCPRISRIRCWFFRSMAVGRCFVFDWFGEKNCDELRRLAGGEDSLRPLKFLWDFVSSLWFAGKLVRPNSVGRYTHVTSLDLPSKERVCTCSKRLCTCSKRLCIPIRTLKIIVSSIET